MRKSDVPLTLRTNVTLAYARNAGEQAGSMGLARDCNPYDHLSRAWRSWDVGWRGAAHAATGERNPSTKGQT